MPQIFRVGAYLVYFWSNENYPLEPVHVHITQGTPSGNATKVWITRQGKCLLAHNNSKIPERMLSDIMDVIEARSFEIVRKWQDSRRNKILLLIMVGDNMKREYDFSNARKNPYSKQLKRQITINIDAEAIDYFKSQSEEAASRIKRL